MSVYQKLRLLFKASAEAPLKQLTKQNDILIFEQEIEEAEAAVKRAKLHLAGIKTEIKLLQQNREELNESIAKRERQAIQVLESDESLAEELAGIIASEESELNQLEQQLARLQTIENRVASDLKASVRKIQRHRQQLGILRANQHSLHARQMTQGSAHGLTSSINDLNASLQSIQDRQQRAEMQDQAMEDVETDLGSGGIDQRLQQAGVDLDEYNAKAVLVRLRQLKSSHQQER